MQCVWVEEMCVVVAVCRLVAMTASASVVVMVLFFATAVAVVSATASAVVTSSVTATAASFAAEHADHARNLVVGCLAVRNDGTHEVKVLTCTWVVEVDSHGVFLHFDDNSVESVAVFSLKRYDVAFEDVLRVELAVDAERRLRYVEHQFVLELAVCLFARDDKVKLIACLKRFYLLLECREYAVQLSDERKWMFFRTFFHKVVLYVFAVAYVELVSHCNVVVGCCHYLV